MGFSLPERDLLLGRTLSTKWKEIFLALFQGRLSPNEAKKLLLLLAKKGEETSEIQGCLAALRRLEPPRRLGLPHLIDVCGTGGDGMKTFNISTVSGFVVAGAGAYVAKHGNRAVSSRAGSSDLMEALGIRIDIPASKMFEALRKCHLGYFHAPLYHPSFAGIQGVRRSLGVRTLFNLLGPLVNPVQISYQMIGVSHPGWIEPVAGALKTLQRKRAAVVRSRDGLDELSTGETSDIFYIEKRSVKRFSLDPHKLGFPRARRGAYEGGDPKMNRDMALGILEGRLRGPRQDVVLLNSGFALWLAGLSRSIQEGIERGRWAIRTGRALGVVNALKRLTSRRDRS